MQTLPNGWAEARSGLYRMETKVSIAGVEYGESHIASLRTSGALFSGNTVSLGSCVAREIDLVIKPKGTIPRMAEIRVFVRPATDGVETEWLQKGVYYIDTRQADVVSGTLTIHGYDAMLKAEQVYLTDGSSAEEWPRPMTDVASTIAERMGVSIDGRSVIDSTYMLGYPLNYTMRELLGYIAGVNGGNWVVTDVGKLRLVPLTEDADELDLGIKMSSLEVSPAFDPVSRVTILLDEENVYTAGNDTGRELEVTCPWGTQAMADDLLDKLAGYVYQPYSAQGARLDPAAELGDMVTVNGVAGPLAVVTTTFDAACASDIEAPTDEEIEHEYPYTSPVNREITRKIAQTRSEIKQDMESITLRVESTEEDISELELTAEGLSSRVKTAEGNVSTLSQKVDGITLTVTNDGASSSFVLKSGDAVLSSGNITFDGYVTFTGLADGTTTIDGGCIKTGEILADLITAGVLQSKDGETFVLDLDNGTFSMKGSGRFQSSDGKTYIEIEGDEMVMYAWDEKSKTYLDKIHFGFITGADPNDSDGTLDYPYLLLGNSGGTVGMVKEFYNGLWVGNSVPKDLSGNFEGMEKASGFFINTRTGVSYVVNGTDMKDVYAGAEGEMTLTSEVIEHDGDRLYDRMPVCLTQKQYDAMIAAGTYNEGTPYLIKKEV